MEKKYTIADLEFEKSIPPPIPGYFYIDMVPVIDTTSHCDSIDKDYRKIHTPISEMFPIDILAEMRNLGDTKQESYLRQGTQIDKVFYQTQSDRNILFMREEQKNHIQEVVDYQEYLAETFEQAKEPLDDIVEEYPLVPSSIKYSLFVGQNETAGDFKLEKSNTTLVENLITENNVYNSTKIHTEDKICIEVRDGVAFYSPVSYLYRLINQNKK